MHMNYKLTVWIKNHICKHFGCRYKEQPRPSDDLTQYYYDYGIRVFKCRCCGHTYTTNINDNHVFVRGPNKIKFPPGTTVKFRQFDDNLVNKARMLGENANETLSKIKHESEKQHQL